MKRMVLSLALLFSVQQAEAKDTKQSTSTNFGLRCGDPLAVNKQALFSSSILMWEVGLNSDREKLTPPTLLAFRSYPTEKYK